MAESTATNGPGTTDGQQNGTSDEPLRIGISGLGRSGWGIHANVLAQIGEKFRVAAVCDPDPVRQEEAIDRFDCLAYSTIDEIIADKAVELLVVATPSQLHVSDVSAALRAGKHVIVEKTDGPDVGRCRRDDRCCRRDRDASDRQPELSLSCRFPEGKGGCRFGCIGPRRADANHWQRLSQTLGLADAQALRRRRPEQQGRPFHRLGNSLFRRSQPGDLLPDGDDTPVRRGRREPCQVGH